MCNKTMMMMMMMMMMIMMIMMMMMMVIRGPKASFDSYITLLGVLPSIAEALNKYELFDHFENCYDSSSFPAYTRWKKLCGIRSSILRGTHEIASNSANLILT